MSELGLPEKVTALDEALEQAAIPHAFGGALALAYYAEPRATIDVDINVFLPPAKAETVRAALEPLGIDPTRTPIETIERDGQGRWWWGSNPVDLFFANHEIHRAMANAVRTVPFGDRTIPILGPEHLTICKVMFDRPKDWIDIEQMLAATGLEVEEVDGWLHATIGEEDARTARFAKLAARSLDPDA